MSDHPENQGKMHELLEAYARKRRADAGEPAEMHPATRKLLQAEVRKQYPPGPKAPSSWLARFVAFLPLYLPRLALAFGLLVLLGVSARFLFRNEQQPLTFELAQQNVPPSLPEPAPLSIPPAAPPAPPAPIAPIAPIAPTTPAPLAEGEALITSSSRPASPSPVRKPAELTLKDEALKQRATRFDAPPPLSTRSLSPPTSPPPAPVVKPNGLRPAPALAAASMPRDQALPSPLQTAEQRQLSDSELAPASRSAVVTAAPGTATTRARFGPSGAMVLAYFELQQVGRQLRIIDVDDGSVYEGQMVVPNTDGRLNEAAAQFDAVAPTVESKAKADNSRYSALTQPAGEAGASRTQLPPGWNFRVSGLNRTLQEPVVMDGVLLTASEVPAGTAVRRLAFPVTNNAGKASAPGVVSGPRFYRTQAPAQLFAVTNQRAGPATGPPTNLAAVQRVQGTLRIGTTNLLTIDAYRAGK